MIVVSWVLVDDTPITVPPESSGPAADLARDLALDTEHELLFVDGDLVLTRGFEGLRQDLDMRLRTFAGEWFLDESVGVPYFENVLVKSPDTEQIRSTFRNELLRAPGVISVTSIDLAFDRSARTLRIDWTVVGDPGTVSGTTNATPA